MGATDRSRVAPAPLGANGLGGRDRWGGVARPPSSRATDALLDRALQSEASMLTPRLAIIALLAAGTMQAGCFAGGEVRATYTAPSPRLVWVSPGIWVVADYEHPVFYDSGYYWMYSDGVWLRSDHYAGTFVRVAVIPPVLLHIHRPQVYVRYRVPHGARVRVIDHRRDHDRPRRRR
jgi:hypothetical protein